MRKKVKSMAVEKAQKRLAGLESISSTLDLGNGLTVANYAAKIQQAEAMVDAYNQVLSQADASTSSVKQADKELRDLTERMLEAVATVYGKDSLEYKKAGGTRKSERKSPKHKTDAKKAA